MMSKVWVRRTGFSSPARYTALDAGLTPDSRLRAARASSSPCHAALQPPRPDPMRSFLFAAALTLLFAGSHASAQDNRLPDIGSSAGTVLSPAQQQEYGEMLLAQLRHYELVLEDPLVDSWLRSAGNRLASASDQPRQPFTDRKSTRLNSSHV